MAKLGKSSKQRLSTCHASLQEICNELIKEVDFIVICGERGKEEQDGAFSIGASKLQFPKSKHNKTPSEAVDIAPYTKGIDWNNHVAFADLAARFKRIAKSKGVSITWGGDWKMRDLVHFELK